LPGTSALAYLVSTSVMKKKSFITLTPVLNAIKTIFLCHWRSTSK